MTDLISLLPDGYERDLPLISSAIDFLGVNYYERQVIAADPMSGAPVVVPQESTPHADNGREIYSDGLKILLRRIGEEYGVERVFITENGIGDHDVVGPDGQVDDSQRIDFINAHLRSTAEAIGEGVNVAGFLVWSFMDNFEWAKGYDPRERYGMVYVDYETEARIVKQSGQWYRGLIAAHRSRSEIGT